jgi:hypothetical protein
MFVCLVDAKFNMTAKVLSPLSTIQDATGHYVNIQDDDTGEIKQVWVADQDAVEAGEQSRLIRCMVRPVVTNGVTGGGSMEHFTKDGIHEVMEFIHMKFPSSEVLTDSDRITEIRNQDGVLLWAEEISNGNPATFKGTVFDVVGVAPIIDPFGTHVENLAYLKRTGVQNGS